MHADMLEIYVIVVDTNLKQRFTWVDNVDFNKTELLK